MLLFIVIFFVMVIAVGAVAAVLGFSFYLKRRAKSLDAIIQKQFNESPPPRRLFEPDAEEQRAI